MTKYACVSYDGLSELFDALGRCLKAIGGMLRSGGSKTPRRLHIRFLADVLVIFASATRRMQRGRHMVDYCSRARFEEEDVDIVLERLNKLVQRPDAVPTMILESALEKSARTQPPVIPPRLSSGIHKVTPLHCCYSVTISANGIARGTPIVDVAEEVREGAPEAQPEIEALPLVSHAERLSVIDTGAPTSPDSPLPNVLHTLTHGIDLHNMQDDEHYEKALALLIQEWFYTGASLFAVISADATIFGLAPNSYVCADGIIKRTLTVSSAAAALGLCANIWLVIAYAGTGTTRFKRLAQDLRGMYLLNLSMRLPLFVLSVAVLALAGCLTAIAWCVWPTGVTSSSLLGAMAFSLQFIGCKYWPVADRFVSCIWRRMRGPLGRNKTSGVVMVEV
ncbi:hypothetical protein BC834DRAFT_852572 [Gloeopeniophorella convolvens]|nr:hypothetical protein BC834DRAFT_852572 [Gloeopeniophorella convolvens]